jgi:hypothetical protein
MKEKAMSSKSSKKKQSQSEAPEIQNGENIPPTIVESSEEQVFAQAEEVSTQEQKATQEKKQPAPKPPKPSKRPYIPLVESHLEAGDMTKKDLVGNQNKGSE